MLTLESLNADRPLFVFLAIAFAEKVLPIWEGKYPEDMRPRKAIEAAKEWLSNPSDAAANDAYIAYADAAAVACVTAADAHAAKVAYAAANAVNAAANAVNAAHAIAYADDAADAAADAVDALEADKETFVHEVILENIDWILQYKIDNGQNFAQPELILNYLTEEQKQSFLFNLDAVA